MLNGFASSLSLNNAFSSSPSVAGGGSSTSGSTPRPSANHSPNLNSSQKPNPMEAERNPLLRLASSSTLASTTSSGRTRSRSAGEDAFFRGNEWDRESSQWDGTSGNGHSGPLSAPPEEIEDYESERRRIANEHEDDVDLEEVLKSLDQFLLQLESPTPATGQAGPSRPRKIHVPGVMAGMVKVLKRSVRARYELDLERVVNNTVQYLTEESDTANRASSYRLWRHLLVDRDSWAKMQTVGVEWLLMR